MEFDTSEYYGGTYESPLEYEEKEYEEEYWEDNTEEILLKEMEENDNE